MSRRLALAAIWLAVAPTAALASAAGPPPTFVVIFIDDK